MVLSIKMLRSRLINVNYELLRLPLTTTVFYFCTYDLGSAIKMETSHVRSGGLRAVRLISQKAKVQTTQVKF